MYELEKTNAKVYGQSTVTVRKDTAIGWNRWVYHLK